MTLPPPLDKIQTETDLQDGFSYLRHFWNLQPWQCLVTVASTGQRPPLLQYGGRFLSGTRLQMTVTLVQLGRLEYALGLDHFPS